MDTSFDDRFPDLLRTAYQVAYQVLGDRSVAEDIAAEATARALVRWPRVQHRASGWVATVAVRLAIDHYRHSHRQPAAGWPADGTADDDRERRLDLHAALRRLPRRQRQVLACRYFADLSDADTAAFLGISQGAIKQHAARGLAALRSSPLLEGPSHA